MSAGPGLKHFFIFATNHNYLRHVKIMFKKTLQVYCEYLQSCAYSCDTADDDYDGGDYGLEDMYGVIKCDENEVILLIYCRSTVDLDFACSNFRKFVFWVKV